MKYIDLTHAFTATMPAYPGDPASSLSPVASIEKDGYTDHALNTQMHVGTHIDAPLHMIANGKRIDELPLDSFFGPGILIDARGKSRIDERMLNTMTISKGSVVLIFTGFGQHYRDSAYFQGYPHVTEGFAQRMVELGVIIVGMDILGPDEPPFATHKKLLGNNILIIENLANLDQLVGIEKFDVIALPAKLSADAAPVRVIAVV